MLTIGSSLTDALLACSDREVSMRAVVGERIVEHLARQGLMVVAIPTKPIRPLAVFGAVENATLTLTEGMKRF
jgi:hypothetical protein